jgi:hypothetical protein
MAEAITNIATVILLSAAITTLATTILQEGRMIRRPIPVKVRSRRRSGQN